MSVLDAIEKLEARLDSQKEHLDVLTDSVRALEAKQKNYNMVVAKSHVIGQLNDKVAVLEATFDINKANQQDYAQKFEEMINKNEDKITELEQKLGSLFPMHIPEPEPSPSFSPLTADNRFYVCNICKRHLNANEIEEHKCVKEPSPQTPGSSKIEILYDADFQWANITNKGVPADYILYNGERYEKTKLFKYVCGKTKCDRVDCRGCSEYPEENPEPINSSSIARELKEKILKDRLPKEAEPSERLCNGCLEKKEDTFLCSKCVKELTNPEPSNPYARQSEWDKYYKEKAEPVLCTCCKCTGHTFVLGLCIEPGCDEVEAEPTVKEEYLKAREEVIKKLQEPSPSKLKCDYCKGDIPHIFAGDEIEVKGKYYFACMPCVNKHNNGTLEKKEPPTPDNCNYCSGTKKVRSLDNTCPKHIIEYLEKAHKGYLKDHYVPNEKLRAVLDDPDINTGDEYHKALEALLK